MEEPLSSLIDSTSSSTNRKLLSYRCDNPSYKNACEDSFGFFNDIFTNEQWDAKKKWLHQQMHIQVVSNTTNSTQNITFRERVVRDYTNHWNPDFACPFQSAVGPVGDGHKWVCDPHRLRAVEEDCLIYSVGSNGQFGFEAALLDIAPNCEIHIFDPLDYSSVMKAKGVKGHFHSWGLTSSAKFASMQMEAQMNSSHSDNMTESLRLKNHTQYNFKDIVEIRRLLNHTHRTIHLFKIDCEGCEWESYLDWLPLDIRQIQVETHLWNRGTLQFFEDVRAAGYAMFSKEANILMQGICTEFSFLRLRNSFFHQSQEPTFK